MLSISQSSLISQPKNDSSNTIADLQKYNLAMQRLIEVVQELSLTRDLQTITTIVSKAARELTGADGATFVLRDGDNCFYVDENAISPLWKGCRFPLSICIGGFCMLNREQIIIKDISGDERVPYAAYQPTFVKSLVMVPIRKANPIGAIGTYWATQHQATPEEVQLLQALADTTSVALENVQVYTELEQRVQDRTVQLEAANQDLKAFAYTLSHDLRSPLTQIKAFSDLLNLKYSSQLEIEAGNYLKYIQGAAKRMNNQITEMLALHKLIETPLKRETVNLSQITQEILANFQIADAQRQAVVDIEEDLLVEGDPVLLHIVLDNLLSNAWKYSGKKEVTYIKFAQIESPENEQIFYVQDHGAGFNMANAERLFLPFQRMHSEEEFTGTGVGLTSTQSIIQKHGGKIWAESVVEEGTTFYFTIATPKPTLQM